MYQRFILILFSVCFISCAKQTVHAPSNQEIESSQATKNWLQQNYGFVQNKQSTRLINRIKSRLADTLHRAALEQELNRINSIPAKNLPWQVHVLDAQERNAFSLGAGVIVITKGLFRSTGSEAELASVIAHEMAHQLLGHTKSALSNTRSDAPQASFSVEQEIEADSLGLKMLLVARYDPRHALTAMSMQHSQSIYRPFANSFAAIPPKWLRKRMANLKKELQEVKNFLPATQNTREFMRVQRKL